MLFLLKRIKFLSFEVLWVVLQNKNGPCPLVAIANSLILENRLSIPESSTSSGCVDSEVLLGLVAEEMMKFEKTTGDAFAALSQLGENLDKGIYINVKFSSCDAFEFTQELGLFDALGLTLLHSFVVDADDPRYAHVNTLSYNQAVDKLVAYLEAEVNEDNEAKEAIESFLNEGQLTYPGLLSLFSIVRDNQVFCLYKQGHFSCAFKNQNGRLFTLVSDVSFVDTSVVWESLDDVTGDSEFVTADFRSLNSAGVPVQSPPPPASGLPIQSADGEYASYEQQRLVERMVDSRFAQDRSRKTPQRDEKCRKDNCTIA